MNLTIYARLDSPAFLGQSPTIVNPSANRFMSINSKLEDPPYLPLGH